MDMPTATHAAARLRGIAPQFLVDDLDRAAAYYCVQLGFTLDFTYESFYASVSRDGCSIHLKHGPALPARRKVQQHDEHLDAYISVTDARALFDELTNRGANIVKPLEQRPWACVDFYVEDADGYLLCFSESQDA